MAVPNQTITVPYTSEMTFSIVETKTGNQLFSASATQTATASAYTYPMALSVASKLATELALHQGGKLIGEYLSNKSNKSNKSKTCNYSDESYMSPSTDMLVTYTADGTTYTMFTYLLATCTYMDSCNPDSINSQQCSCCGDRSYNSLIQQNICNMYVDSTCGNTLCGGCPSGCSC